MAKEGRVDQFRMFKHSSRNSKQLASDGVTLVGLFPPLSHLILNSFFPIAPPAVNRLKS